MLNFFKKKNTDTDNEIWYSFFKSLNDYCLESEKFIKVNCKQYDYPLEYYTISFPYYYETEEGIKRFKELPYKNMYEILNIMYSKTDVETIDIEEAEQNKFSYDFLYIEVPANVVHKLYFKVFFVTEYSGRKSYRVLYHQSRIDNLENIATKIQNMPIDFSMPYSSKEPKHFLQAMVALAKYANIEIPKELEERCSDITIATPANIDDFERIIKLVNLHPYSEKDLKKHAKKFYNIYLREESKNTDDDEDDDEEDDEDDSIGVGLFSKRFKLVSEVNYWEYDWKFSPEEAIGFINDLLVDVDLPIKFEGEWSFTYPEDTYSHDLFPYIQESLEKIGLNLMNIETFGDNYIFFLVKKEDVDEILKLSEKIALGFKKMI